jgi:hypothetical protein
MRKGFEKEGQPLCRGEEGVFTDYIEMFHDEVEGALLSRK